ncbi:MAG TPA: beta-ketoacyl synthase chain length factor [Puia sp.]|nr:beta-ketoacyl synthase chain length factor [Puia sp.]
MLYIHQTRCLSPQQTLDEIDLNRLTVSGNGKLPVKEPVYPQIPPGVLRRMGKAVRMSVGIALPLLQQAVQPDGILIGTANGGIEDCIKFLNQIIEYNEGLLTPGNFVQSTSNAPAAQIALITRNRNYNTTHTHRGLAFENALLETTLLLNENPEHYYLVGAVDEISSYNYNIDRLDGCFKEEPVSNQDLFLYDTPGTIAGEGALMMLASAKPSGAIACIDAIQTLHTREHALVKQMLLQFLRKNKVDPAEIDLLLTGENGDSRLKGYYLDAESIFPDHTALARFKHLSGEYCTASSFGFWLATDILRTGQVPAIAVKRATAKPCKKILIYNNYRGLQHAFALLSQTG